jgi:hypothetical protein
MPVCCFVPIPRSGLQFSAYTVARAITKTQAGFDTGMCLFSSCLSAPSRGADTLPAQLRDAEYWHWFPTILSRRLLSIHRHHLQRNGVPDCHSTADKGDSAGRRLISASDRNRISPTSRRCVPGSSSIIDIRRDMLLEHLIVQGRLRNVGRSRGLHRKSVFPESGRRIDPGDVSLPPCFGRMLPCPAIPTWQKRI